MTAQAPFLVVPQEPQAQVPGAINLDFEELTGDMIVSIATKGSVVAQTTLAQLAVFFGGAGSMARIDLPIIVPSGIAGTSGAAPLNSGVLTGLILPNGFQPTDLTLLASEDGISYFPVLTPASAPWTLTIPRAIGAAGAFIQLPESGWVGANFLKLVSAAAQGTLQNVILIATV